MRLPGFDADVPAISIRRSSPQDRQRHCRPPVPYRGVAQPQAAHPSEQPRLSHPGQYRKHRAEQAALAGHQIKMEPASCGARTDSC